MIDKKSLQMGIIPRRQLALTSSAFALLEAERQRVFRRTGILKPRYEIASEIISNALAGRGESV